jgi:hypothetical protein
MLCPGCLQGSLVLEYLVIRQQPPYFGSNTTQTTSYNWIYLGLKGVDAHKKMSEREADKIKTFNQFSKTVLHPLGVVAQD